MHSKTLVLAVSMLFLSGCAATAQPGESAGDTAPARTQQAVQENNAQTYYSILQKCYGNAIGPLTPAEDGKAAVTVYGREVPLTGAGLSQDVVSKDIAGTMENGGIYPPDPNRPDTPKGVHPGRVRCFPFLYALYGQNKADVEKHLKNVSFMGQNVRFNSMGGAADALAAVSRELEAIDKKHPELNLKVLCKSAGTYLWRNVRGENFPSVHSFGTAIDLNTKYATFWRWQKNPDMRHQQQDRYPREIVEAFEKHGFVWGGKWHEYDIMHFEYRPEILEFARMHAGQNR